MMSSQRIIEYLSNYKFQSNNIEFRIESSKAIESFKNVQSFQLGQLVNGRFHFSQERRELLLLEYDICTRWLYEVEHSIIENSTIDLDVIVELAVKSHETINKIIDDNNDKFDRDFTIIFNEIHHYSFNNFIYELKRIPTGKICNFFRDMVNLVILHMNNSLIELHELNRIMNTTKTSTITDEKVDLDVIPCIYITNLTVDYFFKYDVLNSKSRIDTYYKYFKFNSIRLKNFSDSKIPKPMLETFENAYNIDYRESIN